MAHSIVNRLRKLAGNRRHARRQKAMRRALLLFGASPPGGGTGRRVEGYTRDISEEGLALVVPSLHADDRRLAGGGAALEITLDLRVASVRMLAEAVRREPLAGGAAGCLIAVRVKQMGEGDRALLARHLERLRREVGKYAP